jgi:hypothetical protein
MARRNIREKFGCESCFGACILRQAQYAGCGERGSGRLILNER